VPLGLRAQGGLPGLPAGGTLVAPWGRDAALASFASALHRATSQTMGATGAPLPAAVEPAAPPSGWLSLAVAGAHLSGQPLNRELTELGARLVRAGRTAPAYRLHALATTPPKPGLVRVPADGAAIEIEIWALSPDAFGTFVARVPPPLCIGTVDVDDGTRTSGFLCEPHALAGAPDITRFGGWRKYRESKS
jgi:allophanate hydrolase